MNVTEAQKQYAAACSAYDLLVKHPVKPLTEAQQAKHKEALDEALAQKRKAYADLQAATASLPPAETEEPHTKPQSHKEKN